MQRMCPVIGGLAIILAGLPAAAADTFVTSRVEAQAGYESNRMQEFDGEEGAPYWRVSPGLDLTVFGAKTEASLSLDYRQTQYTKREFEAREEALAFARWRYFGGPHDAGVSVGGGWYQDQALPSDDYTFWQASPYCVRMLANVPVELTLNGAFRQTFYDVSVYTSTTDRADTRIEIRPGLRWHPSLRVTVWADLYAEQNLSDAGEAEYSEFGGTLGCEYQPAPRLSLGVWAGTGSRPYAKTVEGENSRDTLTSAGAWATCRLRPWLELFSSVDWESDTSTLEGNDYAWWQASGGMRLQFEHALDGR